MDAEHFDRFIRSLGWRPTRRRVLASGGLLAAAVGAFGLCDAEAVKNRRRKRRKKRRKDGGSPPECLDSQTRCGTECVRGACCPGEACGAGNCACRVSTEGDAVCLQGGALFECEQCTSADCPRDSRCVPTAACGASVSAVCQLRCAG